MRPVVAIVQARMTSTRLPGKIMRPIDGRPMLWYQLQRMRLARRLDRIVIATTTNQTDDVVVRFCEEHACDFWRGPEADVLARYAGAARAFGAATIVRLTSDCPLLDPQLIDAAVERFAGASGACDYLSNMLPPTFPYGQAVEVFTAAALEAADREATDPAEREHVTPFIYWRPARFRLQSLTMSPDLSGHRWTVDAPEDFELVSRLLGTLYASRPGFAIADVLDVLAVHPEWEKINVHVAQKAVSRGSQ